MNPSPPTDDRLYRLLPAIYRLRDAAQGEPLRALLAIIQQELQVVEGDIDALYDNWFIETCQDWVVPYIGDLLDVGELDAGSPEGTDAEPNSPYGQQERRAYVANTLAYRRRKGTMPVLEQLTQDVTGWRSRAVEFGRLVSTTQTLDRMRPRSTTVSLRADQRLQQIGTPFEQQAAYSVEVRPVTEGGRYNVPNVGLYVWRLQSYPLEGVQARAVLGPESRLTGRYYTFNPVGPQQVPLFNQPQTKVDILSLASEINVPAILRRPVLADELTHSRKLRSQGEVPRGIRYFDTDPVMQIFLDGQPRPLPPDAILITDLVAPEDSNNLATSGDADPLPWLPASEIPWDESDRQDPPTPLAHLVAVDPERGRLAVRPGLSPRRVDVNYFYGFSGDVGGGPYSRLEALPTELEASQPPLSPWHWTIRQATSADPNPLISAIAAWNQLAIARYGLRMKTHIPLALITVPEIQVAQVRDSENDTLPVFKPGRVRGLEVTRGLCPNDLAVSPGLAVDSSGRQLHLSLPWCFDGASRFAEVIPNLPQGTGILVLYYQPVERGYPVNLALVPEATLAGYPPGTAIPLAQLWFDDGHHLRGIQPVESGLTFQPGILQGLEVYNRSGTLETLIKPGIAVDDQGQVLILAENYPIRLEAYQGSTVNLVLVPSAMGEQRIQLLLQPALEALQVPHIRLAQLEVPNITTQESVQADWQLETDADLIGRDPTVTVTHLQPGRSGLELQVAAGNVQLTDKTLTLNSPQHIDLTPYAGRTLLLFIADQPDQGVPLTFTRPPADGETAYLGLIPVVPPAPGDTTDPLKLAGVDTGWIALQDSATYRGNLAIAVPPSSRLHIIAADGYRPHLQGTISIQGWTAACLAQGELRLNGLLVEGGLQVLPGSLGKLTLQHCTLVPQTGGIRVYSEAVAAAECDATNFSLLAFVAYCLVALWRLIGQDLGIKTNAPPMTMPQFLQISWQQLVAGMSDFLETAKPPARTLVWGDIPLTATDNDRLEISLYRTISGPLYLADTVPTLRLETSVIDKGQSPNSSAVAIAAPGTTLDLVTTTVLGRTIAHQLEASDCLFTEKVTVERHQEGCIRFCYVPVASDTPRRYRCQPDLALQSALDSIPNGITALAAIASPEPAAADRAYPLFAATAGDGIFKLQQISNQVRSTANWEKTSGDLPNLNLTALTTYLWPATVTGADAAQPDAPQRTEVMVGTATGEIFRFMEEPSEAGFGWRSLPLPRLHCAITRLYSEAVSGTGMLVLENQENLPNSMVSAQLRGQDTRFSQELQTGDVVTVTGVPWRVEQIGRPSGSRTLTLNGRTAQGEGQSFADDFGVGDTITIERRLRYGGRQQTIFQTRTIVNLQPSDASTTLTLNAPFGPAIAADKPQPFIININTELTVTRVFPQVSEDQPSGEMSLAEAPPQAETFQILRLWATTDGSGLWRGTIDGQSWQPLNSGLTNLSLTTVVRDRQTPARLWVGTAGAGVFGLSAGVSSDRWTPINRGLTTGNITALATNTAGELLAATDDGIFSFDPERETWQESSNGLTSRDLTVLAAGPGDAGMFAGSRDGKVFRSTDQGLSWQPLTLDFQSTDITALEIEPDSGDLWLGTAAGEVLRSRDQGASWQSIQAGRSSLATKLQILTQLRPGFTSTHYGDPGYAQLRTTVPAVIRTGAENGAEMGVFNYLRQPQRTSNLQASLQEYLRFGMSAGIFYMT